MKHRRQRKNATKFTTKACCLTALLNGLYGSSPAGSAHGQQLTVVPYPYAPAPEAKPLRYGPFDVLPHIAGSAVYDDNINISPVNEQKDLIWTISPGVTLASGDYRVKEQHYLTVRYSPSFIIFTDKDNNNAIDHDALLEAVAHPGSWTLGVQQSFQRFSGPVVDVGRRVDRDLYNTRLDIRNEISPKTSVQFEGKQSINDYEGFLKYNEWVGALWADYWVTPKVKVGPGVSVGVVDIERSANQTYEQVLVRVSYVTTEKLELRGSAGGEYRQFEGDRSDKFNGVFSLGANYRPTENTLVSLDAYRRDQTSVVLVNQNYTISGFTASVRQGLFEKYALGVAAGYDNLDYSATATGVSASRCDDTYFGRVTAEWYPRPRLAFGAFYQYRENISTSAFDFSNHQFGITASYQF